MSTNSTPEVVVVTGASAGVGRATAEAFGARGARVGLIARDEEGLDGARRAVEEAGGDALVLPADVADAEAIADAAGAVEEAFGPIDVWVNNAMTAVFSPVAEMTAEEFRRVTEVTYLGYVHGTKAALDRMRPRDRGTIVQVGSALAYRGIPLQSAYCASKHAIQGFTESLRSELIHDDSAIQLTMVQLPAMNTPQFEQVRNRLPRDPRPVSPIYQPEVAARAITWAVDHDRDELWVGWPTVKSIVGNRLFPRRLDRTLAHQAWDAQMTDEPSDPDRPDNLFEPVDTDLGAHGPFDDRARQTSLTLWATTHRALVAAVGTASASLIALLAWVLLDQGDGRSG
ncbi:SDR family oxidoreductase [Halomarina halobia]|uniref:SDR family oxidoreductase n=1 Tax=Halomarina halobia TaxID=3033386 RepID=A0ABD6AEP4_9EURY|nr:SDR family oxidoreductase [Halomarina sp. PSR21]